MELRIEDNEIPISVDFSTKIASEVTKTYVDEQDEKTLKASKDYADITVGNIEILLETI